MGKITKKCTKCGKKKEISEYTKDKIQKSGLRPSCKNCSKLRYDPIAGSKYNQKYYQENKIKYIRNTEEQKQGHRESSIRYMKNNPITVRNTYLESEYGITTNEYNDMLVAQNGVCSICGKTETATYKGKTKNLAVDHCHKTGGNRGLLCHKCNTGIGNFEDNIDIMASAISYLKQCG